MDLAGRHLAQRLGFWLLRHLPRLSLTRRPRSGRHVAGFCAVETGKILDYNARELIAAAGEETRAALIAHMKDATRDYVDGYGLAVPQENNVAIGRVTA